MNGEQLINTGGGVSGGQGEIGTHLSSSKCAGLSDRGAVLGVRCIGAQGGYVRSNREFNRPRSNCAGRQPNNNYFWRDQSSFHWQQRVGYKREHWRERKFIRCYVCNRAGHIAYYCHKRHLGNWSQRGESQVIHDAGVGTDKKISAGSKEDIFNLGRETNLCKMSYCVVIMKCLTLSNPSYFRQLTITGRGGFKSPPPLRSRKLLCQSSLYHTCEFYQVF